MLNPVISLLCVQKITDKKKKGRISKFINTRRNINMVLAKDLKSGMTFLNGENFSALWKQVITNQVKEIQSCV